MVPSGGSLAVCRAAPCRAASSPLLTHRCLVPAPRSGVTAAVGARALLAQHPGRPCCGRALLLGFTQEGRGPPPRKESTPLTPLCTPQVHPRCLLPKGHGHHRGRVSIWWGGDGGTARQGAAVHRWPWGSCVGQRWWGALCPLAAEPPGIPLFCQERQRERPHPQADEDLGL